MKIVIVTINFQIQDVNPARLEFYWRINRGNLSAAQGNRMKFRPAVIDAADNDCSNLLVFGWL